MAHQEDIEITVTLTSIPGEGVFDLYMDREGIERGSIQYRLDSSIAALVTYDDNGRRTGFQTVGRWGRDRAGQEAADAALREAITTGRVPDSTRSDTSGLTVYTTPDCPGCMLTKNQFAKKGVDFREVDVTKDAEAREMLRAAGFATAPVIRTPDGEMSGGYRPDRIKAIISTMAPNTGRTGQQAPPPAQPPSGPQQTRGPRL